MVTKDIIEEYTKYIDPSDMIIEYYKNQATAGLEKYFLQIEDWLANDLPPDKNKPLIIQADEGVGKKTLLVQWMKYHQQKSQKNFPDLIISHFAGTEGNNENYFYAIYKILVRLREHFNVSQKVELLEDKLERYFHYWLDVCSRALIGRIVDDSTIILVFEGINLFRDPDTHEEANVGLWLPKTFPARIRVVITAESDSLALKHFRKIGCDVISIENESMVPSTLTNNIISRPSFITDDGYRQRVLQILNTKSPEVLRNSLFIKTYLSALLPYPSEGIINDDEINKEEFRGFFQKMDFSSLEKVNDISELNSFLLDYFSNHLINQDKFKKVMVALNITEKGLSDVEIEAVTGTNEKEWTYIVSVFKTFFMKYRDLWKINNETFKKAIRTKYTADDEGYAIQMHNDIAEALSKKTSNSIRKLEEETFHLFMSKNYFKLKEAVANIENFLLLFNPNNKYDLCRYWQILEQRGFDPSSEYTKAVEGFELHYRPNQEDTFMIILQVSRFLKEFSDFETNFTPKFRHPPIRGGTELKEIGLRREIKKLGMYQAEEWEPEDEEIDELEELEHKLAIEFPDYSEVMIKEMAQQIHSATKTSKQTTEQKTLPTEKAEEKLVDENGQPIDKRPGKLKPLPGAGRDKKSNELFLLEPVEALNVDIPDNREKFRAYFSGLANEAKKAEIKVIKEKKKDRYLDEDDEPMPVAKKDDVYEQRSNFKKSTIGSVIMPDERKETEEKESVILTEKKTRQDHKKERREIEPTFYYYKRWLWMMYPWVCLSSKNNFSKIIYECFSSATEYISVPDEREKTRQALKIAIEAKLKKQSVYAKSDISMSASKLSRGEGSLGKSQRKILPPLDRTTPGQSLGGTDAVFNTSNSKAMRLDTLSPVHPRIGKKIPPNTVKDPKFFITSEFLTPHYINDLPTSNMEPSMISKVSPTNSTFRDISLLNRSSNPNLAKDKSIASLASNRKVEDMLKNANEASQTLLLPKYQDSLLSTSNRQVDDLENRVTQLQSQYDEIVYMNKVSAKKLKDISIVEVNLKAEGVADALNKAQLRFESLNVDITKAEKMKIDAVKQGERLSKIIAVCVKNKSQNVLGVQSLNYLLNNFKKIIAWEQEDVAQITAGAVDLEKLSKEYIKAYEDRLRQQERAIQHVRKEKLASYEVEKRLDSVYDNLEKTAVMATENMRKTHQMRKEAEEKKQRMENNKEKAKNAKENVEEMRETFEKVKSVIGLDFESSKFQGFLDYIEKINDFQRSIYECKDENEKLTEEKLALASYLETLQKAKSSQKKQGEEQKAPYKDLTDKDQLNDILTEKRRTNEYMSREIAKKTQLALNSKMVLSNVCKELGIKIEDKTVGFTVPSDEIIEKVQDKMKNIQETIAPGDFERFQKGEGEEILDRNYQEQKRDFEIDKRFAADENDDSSPEPNIFRKGAKIIEAKYK